MKIFPNTKKKIFFFTKIFHVVNNDNLSVVRCSH